MFPNDPLKLPKAVRTALTITASRIVWSPSARSTPHRLDKLDEGFRRSLLVVC
jgi:hypothetical protein